MISSSRNPRIQEVRQLLNRPRARKEARAFVVEGVRLAEEALQAKWPAKLILSTGDLSERGQRVVESFRQQGSPVEEVAPGILKSLSDTEAPQGLLAVIEMRAAKLPPAPDFVLIADGVRDPGNLGTILRTAAAAGVQAVLLPPGSVDAYAPKVVRSAMGAHFRLPVSGLTWPEIHAYLYPPGLDARLTLYLADSNGGLPYTQVDFRQPLALIVGGEAEGAGSQARQMASGRVHVPMPGQAESLNVAVAAAILMFEAVRQRGEIKEKP